MKNIYFIIILFLGSFAFAQSNKQISNLVDAEMKSARNLKSFVANPNTDNYDITYHKLEFTVDPTVYFISGKVTTNFIANSNMSTLTFDMSTGLTATSVKINGVSTTFSQSGNNELVINLSSILASGTAAISEVIYSGNPTTTGFGSFEVNTHNGTPVLWTLSEPYGARDWWPCKQDLNDKINAIDVYVTAPSQYTAVSNGVEPEIPVIVGANKTTHFRHQYAIPAYLIAIAVTNYSVYNQSGGTFPNNYPIVNYVYPENLASAQSDLAQTPLILNLYESLYEVYPFKNEKYGHAQFGWGGGMEHTTVSFMGGFGRGLIAHEMAHQWFGDKITCGTWKDIWLNESFATYLAAQVIENFDGIPAFISEKSEMINYITSVNDGNVYKTDSEILTVGGIFDYRTTYIKGAMVIEMLRFKMGDALFFQGVRNYLADANLAYKYAITTDLQSHLEAVYGSSLQEFFNDWVYGQGYPSYYITGQKISDTQTKFQVFQNTPSNPNVSYFEMPVPIRVLGTAGQVQNLILQNNSNGQIFIENIPFDVVSIIFDSNKHLISKENITDVLAPALANENFDLNLNIVVAPNPANDFVNVIVPSFVKIKKISIYNTLGQKVLENTTGTVFVNDLSNGIYNLEVNTSEGMIHKKFIKN